MAGKITFFTDKAPKPKGPYSQAIMYNGLLFLSGQIPVDPVTGLLVHGTIEEETETVISNIRIIAEEAGAGLVDVLKVTCYLADMDDFQRFNDVYSKYFKEDPPARSTIQAAKLPLDVQIEIEAIIALPIKEAT